MRNFYIKLGILWLAVFFSFAVYSQNPITSDDTYNDVCNIEVVDGSAIGTFYIFISTAESSAELLIKQVGGKVGDSIKVWSGSDSIANPIAIYDTASVDISFFQQTKLTVAGNEVYIKVVQNDAVASNSYSIEFTGKVGVTVNFTDISCLGLSDGKVQITTTTNSDYFIKGLKVGDNKQTYIDSTLSAGVYSWVVEDKNNTGCKTEGVDTIYEPSPTFNAVISEDKQACYGKNDAILAVKTLSGTVNSYIWEGGQTSDTVMGIPPETSYSCKVTGGGECIVLNKTTSSSSTEIFSGLIIVDSVICPGSANGEVTISPTGGSGIYSYSWTDVSLIGNRNDLGIGNHTVTITDNNDCFITEDVSITNSDTLQVAESVTNVKSYATNTGEVSLTASRGVSPYSYKWQVTNTSSTTPFVISSLYSGVYNYSVKDANNCEVSDTVMVAEPSNLLGGTIAIDSVKKVDELAFCSGHSIDFELVNIVMASGGVPNSGIIYTWQIKTGTGIWSDAIGTQNKESIEFANQTITNNTWFRRRAVANSDTAYSNEVKYLFIPSVNVNILGVADKYCQNDETLVNVIGVPTSSNGVFTSTDNLVSDNSNGTGYFTPNVLYGMVDTITVPQDKVIIYTYTDSYNCVYSIDSTITIKPMPAKPKFDLPEKLSKSDTVHQITGISPSGGVFTGEGITSAGKISMVSLNETSYPYTYTLTNLSTGCKNDTTRTTTIVAGAGSFLDSDGGQALKTYFCVGSGQSAIFAKPTETVTKYIGFVTALGAVDSNIVWNTAVDSALGYFIPASIPEGGYTVRFRYESNASVFTIEKEIRIVDMNNTAQINNLNAQYCFSNTTVSITSANLKLTEEGLFSGDGIVNQVGNRADFSISTASEYGDSVDIKYILTDNISGCKDSAIQMVTIYDLPIVGFDIKDTFFVKEDPEIFSSVIPSSGGIFMGDGVVSNPSIAFNPSVAGIGLHNITYTYEEDHGTIKCLNDTTRKVLVENYRGEIAGFTADSIFCADGNTIELYYDKEVGYNYSNGSFLFEGVTYNSDTIRINPANISNGNHTLKYSYIGSDGITQFWIDKEFYLDNIGTLSIQLPQASYCEYESEDTLVCLRNGVYESTGLFSFSDGSYDGTTGLYRLTDANKGKAKLKPVDMSLGISTILYTYNSSAIYKTKNSGCFKKDSVSVTINPTPVVNFSMKSYYNVEEDGDTLIGLPSGGMFMPKAFFDEDSIFIPRDANPGSGSVELDIKYIYVEPSTLCTDTAKFKTTVENSTGVIVGLENPFCYGDLTKILTVSGVTNSNGGGGVFFGDGIEDSNKFDCVTAYDNLGQPEDVLVKIPIKYEYTGKDNVTKFNIYDTATVINNGTAQIIGLTNDKKYCANADSVILSATPVGGYFEGNEIFNDSVFYPTAVTGDSTIITYKYADPTGTCAEIVTNEKVYIKSLPNIIINAPSAICSNGMPDTIIATPDGGFYSSTISSIGGTNDTIVYYPSPADIGVKKIRYTYTNQITQCTNTDSVEIIVNNIPVISISGFNIGKAYCKSDDLIPIVGVYGGIAASSGSFINSSVVFDGDNVYDNNNNDGKAMFSPRVVAESPKHSVGFSYIDVNGCSNTVYEDVTVYPLPNISLSGLTKDVYCENGAEVENLVGNYTGIAYGEEFTVNGRIKGTNNYLFKPVEYNARDTIIFNYWVKDIHGCSNSVDDTASIYPIPDLDLTVSDKCIADSVQYSVLSNTPAKEIISYNWSFYSINDPNDAQFLNGAELLATPSVKYTQDGRRTVSLAVIESRYSCRNQVSEDFYFERTPDAKFTWINECINQGAVEFTPKASNDSSVYSYIWDFGDGTIQNAHKTSHSYGETNTYNVKFRIQSINSDCADEITKTITIRPKIKLSDYGEYLQSFETEHGGWIPETLTEDSLFTWELGRPNGALINKAFDGNNAYVTGLQSDYKAYEKSAITSPCFDFTGMSTPMISLAVWTDLEANRDGAVLQYRTNEILGEAGWQNVGVFDAEGAINWYNSPSINGLRDISDREGWDGEDTPGWMEARHSLDFLKEQANVRFRIAFGADDIEQREGIAIDKIRIGDRQRKVIIENYTNAVNNIYKTTQDGLSSITSTIPNDIIEVQYHAGYPSGDPLYRLYPGGVNTRIAYYGIGQIPYAVFDGIINYDFSSKSGVSSSQITRQALMEPLVDINMDIDNMGSKLTVNANISTNKPDSLNGRNIYVLTYVLEDNVLVTIDNKNIEFDNVVRTILPDASGTYLQTDWNNNKNQKVSVSYELPEYINSENITIVMFVQDEDTREILQATTSDKSIYTVSSIDEDGINSKIGAILFPNPASEYIDVIFNTPMNSSDNILLINQQGAVVKNILPIDGEQLMKIDVISLQEGMYYFTWIHDGMKFINKLVIIK